MQEDAPTAESKLAGHGRRARTSSWQSAAPLVDHQPTALRTWLRAVRPLRLHLSYPLERNTFDSHSSRVGRCLPAPGPGPMTVTVKSRCFSFLFNDTARLRRPRRALHPRETPYARAGLARPGRPLCLSIAATFVGSG